jgi:hypothetical protein
MASGQPVPSVTPAHAEKVRASGLPARPCFVHHTLRTDRADLMRWPCLLTAPTFASTAAASCSACQVQASGQTGMQGIFCLPLSATVDCKFQVSQVQVGTQQAVEHWAGIDTKD